MTNNPLQPSSDTLDTATVTAAGIPQAYRGLVALIRAKMRDFSQLNRLIEGEETSDTEILLAIMETIEDFNLSPPLIGVFTLLTFPSGTLLISGTISNILESLAVLQTRNHMVYSDGQGMQVSSSDKAPQLMQLANLYKSRYEMKRDKLKIALNLAGGLNRGCVPSEYAIVNGALFDFE